MFWTISKSYVAAKRSVYLRFPRSPFWILYIFRAGTGRPRFTQFHRIVPLFHVVFG